MNGNEWNCIILGVCESKMSIVTEVCYRTSDFFFKLTVFIRLYK